MLKSNEAANNINNIVLNYKYLRKLKFLHNFKNIFWLVTIWIDLIKNVKKFFFVKYKWFKFFKKFILHNIYVKNLNKFEQKIRKIHSFKVQIIVNSFKIINNLFFKGVVKKSNLIKNKKKWVKHWLLKSFCKFNLLSNKLFNFITKIKKLDQKINLFITLKIKKLFFYNLSDWLLKDFLYGNRFFKKAFNLIIFNYFLSLFDNFALDLLNTNQNKYCIWYLNKYFISLENKLFNILIKSLFINYIKFNLFFNVKKEKKLSLKKRYLNFLNYIFSKFDCNNKTSYFLNKIQSLKKYKHRFLMLLNQNKIQILKTLFYRLNYCIKSFNTSVALRSDLKNQNQFFDFKNHFKVINFAFKKNKTNFNLFFLNKQKYNYGLNKFAPFKKILKNLQIFGFLSCKKNMFCINNVLFFNSYISIVKLYSIIIIKLLFYYKKTNNFIFLKKLCLNISKSCILTLKFKCKSIENYSQIFQRYYNFIKFKFFFKWKKFIQKSLTNKKNYKFNISLKKLNFNVSYIISKFKVKNYFYNFA